MRLKCKKKGHIARVCRSRPPRQTTTPRQQASHSVRQVGEESDIDVEDSLQPILTVQQRSDRTPPIQVHVEIDKCTVAMEVDTGTSVSLMGEAMYRELWPRRGLGSTTIRLQTYSKEPIAVVGSTDVQVCYEGQIAVLPLIVVKGEGPTLLGRNWLSKIRLNWGQIHSISKPGLPELLAKYQDVFKEGLGTFQAYEAKIEVNSDASPCFCKA